ncbi:unnamed protein product [Dicrocoelium dendriticum]|nr:unnamed protein product [Dicrocoelium dendriticum]
MHTMTTFTVIPLLERILPLPLLVSARATSSVPENHSGSSNLEAGWQHVPLVPGRRVVRMYPVLNRHRPRIVLVREGCTNRPFFTIQIKSNLAEAKQAGIEQVGSWDPFPNKDYGEQLVALNLKRISYWMAQGAEPSDKVAELLGLAGFLPVHPRSYLTAHRARLATTAFLERQKTKSTELAKKTEAEENEVTTDNSGEMDVNDRPDSVWRHGNEPSHWWYWGVR